VARFANWAGHAVKQRGWNLNLRAALGGLALVGGVALLAAFYLALSSQTAVLGRRLQSMEEERAQLVRQNAYLRDQIARSASGATLIERAFASGYVTTGTIHFISVGPPDLNLEMNQVQAPP
jgi:cell division protein FtsB